MASVLAKTELGAAEIRDRAYALSRQARTLLVLADGSRATEQLLSMVQGSSMSDVGLLVEMGLLVESDGGPSNRAAASVPVAQPVRAPAPVPAPMPSAAPADAAPAPAAALGYRELYDSLNALAKQQLGLIKGYRFALEIEKASGVEELREVAHRLADEVGKSKGESAAQMVRRALGLQR